MAEARAACALVLVEAVGGITAAQINMAVPAIGGGLPRTSIRGALRLGTDLAGGIVGQLSILSPEFRASRAMRKGIAGCGGWIN